MFRFSAMFCRVRDLISRLHFYRSNTIPSTEQKNEQFEWQNDHFYVIPLLLLLLCVCGIIAEPKRIAETEIYLNAFMILRLISDRELLKVTTFSV